MDSETKKLYVNVGLVGAVSNGKTTLVKCLTGVSTKRDSTEIKTGRTVKLGYANCTLWKCPSCDTVYTTGQKQKGIECCTFDLIPTHHVSFLDAPGHHSYVHNMIKGSSVIDCAIIVSDVRADALQIQTFEHLIILEAMNVKNVLVVQNKIDLVDSERCLVHYKLLKEELKGTVAENSPIIPISAQSGIGLEELKNYLYRMVEGVRKNIQKFPKNVFSIIRSFDINKPDTPLEKIRGGVIGGTVLGDGFRVNDEIEIRPGHVKSPTESVPITTKIFSIFSEEEKCEEMGHGGLYGVGTNLDPALTKADGMVGCLAGKPEDLPEVVHTLHMYISRLKKSPNGDEVKKIEKGESYQLIIGSIVIKAVAERFSKETGWQMKLSRPICTFMNKAMIYTADEKCQLIGFGTFGETLIHPIENAPIPQSEEEYLSLLPSSEKKKAERAKIPVPSLAKESCNVIWGNITVFCETIHRDPEHVSQYIKEELCMEASFCQNGLRIYKAKLNTTKFQTILKKYIRENVCCGECKGLNTELKKNPVKGYDVHCVSCGSARYLGYRD